MADVGRAGKTDSLDESWIDSNGTRTQHSYNSSSNSNDSSISSITSSSSDSDVKMTTGAGDPEADADSLTCRQSGLSSNDQLENDCHKLVTAVTFTFRKEPFYVFLFSHLYVSTCTYGW